jgi:hypothetical protein
MPKGFAVEESGEEATEAIFQLLKTAEKRVARLKWEVAKVKL